MTARPGRRRDDGREARGDRWYRRLLITFPRATRDAAGDDMTRQFRDERCQVAGRPVAATWLWIRAAWDALRHGTLDRLGVHSAVYAPLRDEGAAGVTSPHRPLGFVRELPRDVRLAARRLRRAPAFTVVAVLTLALGIGANTAIFTVVYGVLFKPLPFPDPGRLVGVFQVWEGRRDAFTPPNFLDVQARAKTLAATGAYDTNRHVLTGAGEPASVIGAEVTFGFFETFAVPPLQGRTFLRDEHEPGRTGVVVISERLRRQHFGGRDRIVGEVITLNAKPYEVVGVMPAEFQWPATAEFWRPSAYDEVFRATNRGAWYLGAVGRLAPGVTLEQAQAEIAAIGRQLEQEYPINAKVGMTVHPLLDSLVGDTRRALTMLLAAVGLVLLIACANVANLLLARASARGGEMAVQVALGAGRLRLMRQLLVESLVLAAVGGVAGLAVAGWGTSALVALQPADIPRLSTLGIDRVVVLFALAATVATAVLFGLVPALQLSRRSLAPALHERGRSGTGGRQGQRLRSALVVVEVALAVILLAGAGLLVRSFARLSHVDPGYRVGDAMTFAVGLPSAKYDSDERRLAFHRALRQQIEALPGVSGVSAISELPPSPPSLNLSFQVDGRPAPAPGEEPTLEVRVADERYFDLMGIRVTRGRGFTDADRPGTTPVAVITESAARRYFAGEEPLGRRITLGWRRGDGRVSGEVIGVVADVRSFGLDREAPPQIYVALAQVPIGGMSMIVRTTATPEAVGPSLRAAVAAIDRDLPITRVETLDARLSRSLAEPRFYMLLLGLFAAVAVALCAVGIFGVLAYLVTQRRREFGVRIALGASPASVVGVVLRRAVALSLAGIAAGSLGALALARLLESLLFDLSATDPATFIASAAALFAVAVTAAWIPAHRATRVDPIAALRAE